MNSGEIRSVATALSEQLHANESLSKCPAVAQSEGQLTGESGVSHQIDITIRLEERLILVFLAHWPLQLDIPTFFSYFGRSMDVCLATDDRELRCETVIICFDAPETDAARLANYWRVSIVQADSLENIVASLYHIVLSRATKMIL